MRDLLGLAVVAFVSALVPVVNLEAYLGLRAALADVNDLWLLGFVAAAGQMGGKVIWYLIGASSLEWGWIKRRVEKPKAQARLATWQTRTEERPLLAGTLVFASAVTGLPPFAIVAVLAGQLRMNLVAFFVLGLAGRWLRFSAVLGSIGWLQHVGIF